MEPPQLVAPSAPHKDSYRALVAEFVARGEVVLRWWIGVRGPQVRRPLALLPAPLFQVLPVFALLRLALRLRVAGGADALLLHLLPAQAVLLAVHLLLRLAPPILLSAARSFSIRRRSFSRA